MNIGDNKDFIFNERNDAVKKMIKMAIDSCKKNNVKIVECWGSGSPRREFMNVDDLGSASVFVLENWSPDKQNSFQNLHTREPLNYLNVGTGKDITIKELATTIADVVGFKGGIVWDTSKPNGTPRKVLNIDKIKSLGWEPEIGLKEGLESTYEWYKKSIGYEEVVHKIRPFRRFLNWMDQ